ncbi:peptidoglycan DD-metalloendopeptidase family protein [Altererythrobacter salegens]|uniref:Peptidoglycan DD-metalloendopeptidase family protein n=1 Tax=Croceibacterium salegens TaxID=1737568 RepID=A0A6I4SYF3_9SPHN|nr:M23 family metallopeptidase [Croceibacterium salegens]MXO60428.1 peptidoglycan DD-metalloendopeptidase family protein [Croceibacterium salegens]
MPAGLLKFALAASAVAWLAGFGGTGESAPPPAAAAPATFVYSGELTQGGWLRGQAPAGTVAARLGDEPLKLDPSGHFFAAFDRDAGPTSTLVATFADGRTVTSPLTVSPRAWNIERVDIPRTQGRTTEEFWKIREPELAQIAAARAVDHDIGGWRQDFIWPARGRISGRFGSQRIYRGGEAGSYHSGLDIATGESGTPYVAPADGVVVLAAQSPFSLEGNLLIIDHGGGLNSAFLHSSKLAVKVGDVVRQGQYIGNIGMTGRATGPHLHWSMKWHDARLDPLLFVAPAN